MRTPNRNSMILLMTVFAAGCVAVSAHSQSEKAAFTPHAYGDYEKLVRTNVSQFHKNFNTHDFAKNGAFVADHIHVVSNGAELDGRDAFIARISRFVGPFPDINIDDVLTVVDGNTAVVRYVLTGTQKGDLQTPDGVLAATNRPIKVDGVEFFTFDDTGKLIDLVTIERGDQLAQQLKGKT